MFHQTPKYTLFPSRRSSDLFLKVFIRRQKLLRHEKIMWPKVAGIYLSLGLRFLFSISFFSNLAMSTGLIYSSVFAGYFNNFSFGRVGRFSNPPPQLGQTFCKTFVTQSSQNVHSNVQIIDSGLSSGNLLPQFSHA